MLLAELQSYGFKVAPYALVRSKEDAISFVKKHGYPVVVKLASGEHKTDVGGVVLNIYDEEMLSSALSYFKKKFRRKKVMVQKQITNGIELYVGVKDDETFGRVIVFGLGGIYVEAFKDITSRVCPITKDDASEMLGEVKAARIIEGYRGRKFDLGPLVDALVKTCRFAEIKKAKELDINPLMFTEEGAIVVDARMKT